VNAKYVNTNAQKRKMSILESFHLTPFEVQVVNRMLGRKKSHGCCYSRNTCMII
jgi:hypothetical protein